MTLLSTEEARRRIVELRLRLVSVKGWNRAVGIQFFGTRSQAEDLYPSIPWKKEVGQERDLIVRFWYGCPRGSNCLCVVIR